MLCCVRAFEGGRRALGLELDVGARVELVNAVSLRYELLPQTTRLCYEVLPHTPQGFVTL